jgi:hypothetical protein
MVWPAWPIAAVGVLVAATGLSAPERPAAESAGTGESAPAGRDDAAPPLPFLLEQEVVLIRDTPLPIGDVPPCLLAHPSDRQPARRPVGQERQRVRSMTNEGGPVTPTSAM